MTTQNTTPPKATARARQNTRGFKLICMSFDGEYQVERPTFDSLEAVAEYDNDLGSKWYFYPFHFAASATGKTIKGSFFPLEWLEGKRVSTVARIFKAFSAKPENANMDSEQFAFAIEG